MRGKELTDLSLIIPAHNEEKRISRVIKEYSKFLESRDINYEIIVVSDGTDGTAETARSAHLPNLRVLESKERLGKGGGIFSGFLESKGRILAFVDSDMSVTPRDFWRIYLSANSNTCAIASRRCDDSVVIQKQPLMRRTMSNLFNLYVRALFGLRISDTQCGVKVFPKEKVVEAIKKMKSKGFEFDVELLWRLQKEGSQIVEVPIEWAHEAGSTFTLSNGPSMVFSLLLIRVGL
jgi:dolichol-phosphate mannosyltransferase